MAIILNNKKDKELECVEDDILVLVSEEEQPSYSWRLKGVEIGNKRMLKIKVKDYLNFVGIGISKISCFNAISCVLTDNGNLYHCGCVSYENYKTSFTVIAENVKDVLCVCGAVSYILNNGDIYCYIDKGITKKIGENAVSVSASPYKVCYIDTKGDLYTCDFSQTGSFTKSKTTENVKKVMCSDYGVWYLTKDNVLYGCGYNEYGQQGDGTTTNVKSFTKKAENVKDFACDDFAYSTWYIDMNGDLYGCGLTFAHDNQTVKTFTKKAENISEIYVSYNNAYCIDNNGNLYVMGGNYYGKLPLEEEYIENFTKIAENVCEFHFGYDINFAYTDANGSLYSNFDSEDIVKVADEVQSFDITNLALFYSNEESLYALGYNEYGQLGNGSFENLTEFTEIEYLD